MKDAHVFWFTGLSGAGKTTIAEATKHELDKRGVSTLILDGDDVRRRLHVNLGFTEDDIKENNRLIAQLCLQHRTEYDVILVPIISPYNISREEARKILGHKFSVVYLSANLETVMARDTKGLYAKAKAQEIDNLIGYSPNARYESPTDPEFEIDTSNGTLKDQVYEFTRFIAQHIA